MKIVLTLILIICVYTGWHFGLTGNSGAAEETFAGYITENQNNLDILHYDLELKPDYSKKILKGKAVLTATLLGEIATLDLNFYDNMKINLLTIDDEEAGFRLKGTSLIIDRIPDRDTFLIKIEYEGRPRRGGFAGFVFGERNKSPVIYNLSEPNYASTWFPCNDFPSDKALLDIKITNDSSMVSVSNGKLVNILSGPDSLKTYHWKTIYPVSTYLVSIYSAEYETFSDTYISLDGKDTMNINYFAFKDHLEKAKKDFEDHIKFMTFFASIFGEYPFIKEKYGVAEFLWQLGAMEHQTITGIGSNFVSGKKYFNDVYVHELAHHWWGNAVGPASWKDIWLNEGFATYSEALYAEHTAGKKALQSTMLSKFDETPEVRLYDPEGNLFSSTIYNKGAWVLHMLRRETGDSVFFNILRAYFNEYKYKIASTEDFKRICESISGKDLDYFFRQWVTEGTGIIKMTYKWKAEKKNGKFLTAIQIEQKQLDYIEYKFPLEIEFLLSNGDKIRHTFEIDDRDKDMEIELDFMPVELTVDPDNWLLALANNQEWN